jgi:hypothetical protein
MSLGVGMSLFEKCGIVEIETEILKTLNKISSEVGASASIVGRLNIDYLKPLAVGSKMIRLSYAVRCSAQQLK